MKRVFVILGITLSILVAGGLSYLFIAKDDNNSLETKETSSSNNNQGGLVSTFDFDQQKFVNGSQSNNSAVAGANSNQQASKKDIAVTAPPGWSLIESKTVNFECQKDTQQTISTYTNASKTLTIYKNGSPAGCNNEIVGDVYVDYNYTQDGMGIETVKSDKYSQCTKEQNQTCPKGDGKITVFVGNLSEDNKSFIKNSISGDSYYFVVEDSNLASDLNVQINELLNSIDSVKFAIVNS